MPALGERVGRPFESKLALEPDIRCKSEKLRLLPIQKFDDERTLQRSDAGSKVILFGYTTETSSSGKKLLGYS